MPGSKDPGTRRTRCLLTCGVAGSALFVGSFLIQGATREGYDPARHHVSALSLGPEGWIQIVTFLVTGILMAALAIGLSRALPAGRGSVWIPRLIASFAAGVFLAGVFTGDPGRGYPPGAPENGSGSPSWHAVGHVIGADIMFFSMLAAAVVFTIRFQEEERPVWAFYSAATTLVVFLAIWWKPDEDIFGIVQRVGLIAMFGWVAAIAARTMTGLRR